MFLLTTATADASSISCGETVVKYATFAATYTIVTRKMEMKMARGKFLQHTNRH